MRRGDPPGPAAGRVDARRARGARAAGAAAARPSPGAPARTAPDGSLVAARRSGPHPVGPDARSPRARRWSAACLRRNLPGPYQIQAAINAVHSDAPDRGRTPTGAQILASSTTSCWPWRPRRSSPSIAPWLWPRSTVRPAALAARRRPRPRRVLPLPRHPGRPAPAARSLAERPAPTTPPWPSPPTRPSGRSWNSVARRAQAGDPGPGFGCVLVIAFRAQMPRKATMDVPPWA